MSSNSEKFVLVGPNAGKTLNVNGHEFVDGEMTFHGSEAQISFLSRVLSFYGAVSADKAELAELKAAKLAKTLSREDVEKALAGLPGENTDADYVVGAMSAHFKDLFTVDDEAKVRELVKAPAETDPAAKTEAELAADLAAKAQAEEDAKNVKPTLGEAIGSLDPENDKHWTSNNLPALDVLEALTGKKVARSEVDSVADGYTRAKARAAKQ